MYKLVLFELFLVINLRLLFIVGILSVKNSCFFVVFVKFVLVMLFLSWLVGLVIILLVFFVILVI